MNGELDVSDALIGLGQTTRLRIVKKTVVNFEVSETEQAPKVPLWFDAVIEAVHPRRLLVKPEGQREWKWWDMRSTQRLDLHLGDRRHERCASARHEPAELVASRILAI